MEKKFTWVRQCQEGWDYIGMQQRSPRYKIHNYDVACFISMVKEKWSKCKILVLFYFFDVIVNVFSCNICTSVFKVGIGEEISVLTVQGLR